MAGSSPFAAAFAGLVGAPSASQVLPSSSNLLPSSSSADPSVTASIAITSSMVLASASSSTAADVITSSSTAMVAYVSSSSGAMSAALVAAGADTAEEGALPDETTAEPASATSHLAPPTVPIPALHLSPGGVLHLLCRSDAREYDASQGKQGNFLKGVKWSPDGTCLLTLSEDDVLRLYETPQSLLQPGTGLPLCTGAASTRASSALPSPSTFSSALRCPGGAAVYDYCWYPLMRGSDPSSAAFLVTALDHPVRLIDAYNGSVRAFYEARNHNDELVAAISLAFAPTGERFFAGYNKSIRSFHLSRPGLPTEFRQTAGKSSSANELAGLVSCFAVDSAGTLLAAGSYTKQLALYSAADLSMLGQLQTHNVGGMTQLRFSPDGLYLYSGCRQSPDVIVWDVRQTGTVLARLPRTCRTNQRLLFDLSANGRYLITPSHNDAVLAYDLSTVTLPEPCHKWDVAGVNGIGVHPFLPLLAVSTGERQFPLPEGEEEEPQVPFDITPEF